MSSASPEKEESIFSNGMRTFVTTVSIAVLFLPILLIGKIEWLMDYSAESSTGIVIGIGVILRATLRRLFQTTTQSVVRTSVGISTRLSGRVVARRFVRLFVRMFGRILPLSQNLKDRLEKDKGSSSELVGNENTQNHYINTLIGCVVLFVSLFCVLRLLPDLSQQSVTHGLSIFIYSALGAIPMLLYLLITPFLLGK